MHKQHPELIKPTWENSIPSLNGLILAGGESRRMGRDKSMIDYHGMSQLDYLIDLLGRFGLKTFISCNPQRIPETKHEIIKDTFLDLGPYSGVLSAFRFDPNSAWLSVPCDMPMLNEDIISALIEQRDPAKIATCFHDPSTGFPEPLLTIWEPRAYPILLQNLSQGISCLRKTLINSDAKQIHADHPEVLKNANTPGEVDQMMKFLESKQDNSVRPPAP